MSAHKYMITGYNRFSESKPLLVIAQTPQKALEEYCDIYKIQYNKIEKMTSKYNEQLLDSGYSNMDLIKLIDFVVTIADGITPPSAGGNYRLE